MRDAKKIYDELQQKLAAPARRALERNGVGDIASLAACGEAEIASWHGIGKHAMDTIREALKCYETSPKAVLSRWVEVFNRADADGLAALYAEDAVNHQVANAPVVGRNAIYAMFKAEFAAAEMVCIVENMFEDGEWAIMEWCDPLGLRGCGFFHIVDGKIQFQRGYWDKLSFLRQHDLPID